MGDQMLVYGFAPIAGALVSGILGRMVFIVPESEASFWASPETASSSSGAVVKATGTDDGDMADMMDERTSAIIEAINALRSSVQDVQDRVDKVYEFQSVHGGS